MLNLVSILLGLVALVVALLGVFLGIVNWIALPIAVLGGALGALSSSNAGRNLNIFVLIVASLRLWIGGGIL